MKDDTLVVQAGRESQKNQDMVNAPVYRASTVLFSSLKAYHAAEANKRDPSYGTAGTETTFALQNAIAQLEGGTQALMVPSGLAAITTTLLAFLSAGDHVLVTDAVYGPTRRFCNKMLKRLGVEVTFYDPLIGAGISALIQENTRLVFTESPGSLTFEVQDIPAITKAAHAKNVLVVLDNSWASPLFFKPFEHGVDISIQACTKYISGHSDVLLGSITTKDEKIFDTVYAAFHNLGVCVSPDDCYLAARGLRTMATRLRQHEAAALKVATWLQGRSEVAEVLYPALKTHPSHEIWKRDFKGATGLISVVLDKSYSYEAICQMIDHMKVFRIGASWGGFESLILSFDPRSVRTASQWTKTGSCVRIYAGLEDTDDMLRDLEEGFVRLKKA